MMALSFDDPKPAKEKRIPKPIFLHESVLERIDAERGKATRSDWIEIACKQRLEREKAR